MVKPTVSLFRYRRARAAAHRRVMVFFTALTSPCIERRHSRRDLAAIRTVNALTAATAPECRLRHTKEVRA
ncbi:hypothetical protein VRRI112168_07255 [Vreelandella rituensis]|uniref:Uncharacterized protein n=1 Tax=Vreelandella rituensis TaxID=2282306 RepID=A0A368U7T3_9GAMM|nr:hypothetical protein [Halomonas rituensis]RCV92172.1 hypothetical protein DU506_09225 [Halomonas rituensis]